MVGKNKVGKAHFFKSKKNFAYTTGHPIVMVGTDNTVFAETPDIVFVASNSHTEELKEAVKTLVKDNVKVVEHCAVVEVTALVTRGDEIFELKENESTYIPFGVKHRLENPFK